MPLAGSLFFKVSLSLTKHLLTLRISPPYSLATHTTSTTTFLTQAREENLHHSRLALWLSQDLNYAGHGYPCFIGALIFLIPLHKTDSIRSLVQRNNIAKKYGQVPR